MLDFLLTLQKSYRLYTHKIFIITLLGCGVKKYFLLNQTFVTSKTIWFVSKWMLWSSDKYKSTALREKSCKENVLKNEIDRYWSFSLPFILYFINLNFINLINNSHSFNEFWMLVPYDRYKIHWPFVIFLFS